VKERMTEEGVKPGSELGLNRNPLNDKVNYFPDLCKDDLRTGLQFIYLSVFTAGFLLSAKSK